MLDTRFPDQARERYIVQWITATNRHGELIIMGWCVRDTDDTQWATLFQHEDEAVCRKVCEMLNEEELTKC
jgi:hypothetical protein